MKLYESINEPGLAYIVGGSFALDEETKHALALIPVEGVDDAINLWLSEGNGPGPVRAADDSPIFDGAEFRAEDIILSALGYVW